MTTTRPHFSFWIIATIGLLWNLARCYNYILPTDEAGVARMPELYQLIITVTVNALVVGVAVGGTLDANGQSGQILRQYFEEVLICGPQSFALAANDYGDYATAMRLKPIRELSLPMLGQSD